MTSNFQRKGCDKSSFVVANAKLGVVTYDDWLIKIFGASIEETVMSDDCITQYLFPFKMLPI